MEWKPFDKWTWHRWFAWYPVYISFEQKIWLKWVERRYCGGYAIWEYREI